MSGPPVVIAEALGRPVTNVSNLNGAVPMVVVDALGEPVTLVDAGGEPVTLLNADGTLWSGSVSALTQILALDPTALWWPTEGSGWQGRTGGDLSAVGSPVGILPDLSELGGATLDEWLEAPTTPELVTNGDFSDPVTTGWAAVSGTLSVVDGWLRLTSTVSPVYAGYSFTSVVGRVYQISGEWRSSAGSWRINVGTTNGSNSLFSQSAAANGSFTAYVQATTTTTWVNVRSVVITAGDYAEIDNISVRELPGIHAIAPTDAARPLLGRVPVTGRRNLLIRTEEFENAAWNNSSGVAPTATNIVAPDGTETAERFDYSTTPALRFRYQAVLITEGTFTFSVWLKSPTPCVVGLGIREFVGATGTITTTVNVGTSWQRFQVTATISASDVNGIVGLDQRNAVITGVTENAIIDVWGAQLELGSTATAYQKVVTALDVTEAGVADTYYTSFDGVDDHFALSESIPITTNMTVVRAFGRSAAGIHNVGLGVSGASAPSSGAWLSNNLRYIGLGGSFNAHGSSANTGTGAFVFSARRNASTTTLRQNGSDLLSGTAPTVSGSLSTFGLMDFRYNNGPISFLAVFDRELTAPELELVESIAAGTNGATIYVPQTILSRLGALLTSRSGATIIGR